MYIIFFYICIVNVFDHFFIYYFIKFQNCFNIESPPRNYFLRKRLDMFSVWSQTFGHDFMCECVSVWGEREKWGWGREIESDRHVSNQWETCRVKRERDEGHYGWCLKVMADRMTGHCSVSPSLFPNCPRPHSSLSTCAKTSRPANHALNNWHGPHPEPLGIGLVYWYIFKAK